MITARLPERGVDCHGSGAYRASRGSRIHNGIDYSCWPGSYIHAPADGRVSKIGLAYASGIGGAKDKDPFQYVEITDHTGEYKYRVFYVTPKVSVGDEVSSEIDIIGVAQDVGRRYEGITPHVHFEAKDRSGQYIDPRDLD